jgi:hypothetical protein
MPLALQATIDRAKPAAVPIPWIAMLTSSWGSVRALTSYKASRSDPGLDGARVYMINQKQADTGTLIT